MCTIFVMFTDKLFLGFETICSTFTGLWYGQEKLECPALLILLECYTINICAADISRKAVSLQLKGYTSQQSLNSMWFRYCFTVTPIFITYIFLGTIALSYNTQK
jgi:hypothetical protein